MRDLPHLNGDDTMERREEENRPIANQPDETKVDWELVGRLDNASEAFMRKYRKMFRYLV